MIEQCLKFRNRFYYLVRPLIPRFIQLSIRRWLIKKKLPKVSAFWPIDKKAGIPPTGWKGWPNGKKFAFVLRHDVDTAFGIEKCRALMDIEERLGFRSSFNIVPEDYYVPPELREEITRRGFEVGVHGLKHDGKMFISRSIFLKRAARVNQYLKEWNARGFSSPSMHHNLDWMHDLNIDYDISTFDTDPFEPQTDGVGTIFPFIVTDASTGRSFVELPYTLPQDFTLFVLMQEKNSDIWKKKIDWIAEKGGMALLNIHPDYMMFTQNQLYKEVYPYKKYAQFLEYVNCFYNGQFWHALPSEIAHFCRSNMK
jgi:peptidoglycan/xylan/chitin deacetylase (PgdA/CDA1 family)